MVVALLLLLLLKYVELVVMKRPFTLLFVFESVNTLFVAIEKKDEKKCFVFSSILNE